MKLLETKSSRSLAAAAVALLVIGAWSSLNPGSEEPIEVPLTAYDNPGGVVSPFAIPQRLQHRRVPADDAIVGWYGARIGQRFHYRFQMDTSWEVLTSHEGAQAGNESSIHVAGKMAITILDRREEQILTRLELDQLQFSFPHMRQGQTTEDIERLRVIGERPTHVKLDDEGRILGYDFAQGWDASQRNMLRGLAGAFEFVVPAETEETWEVSSADTAGAYRARYRQVQKSNSTIRVRRQKLEYTRFSEASSDMSRHSCSGAAVATVSREIGWLADAHVDEAFQAHLDMMSATIRVRIRGELRLASTDSVDSAGLRSVESIWQNDFAAVGGQDEDVAAASDDAENRQWARLLDEVTIASLLAELNHLAATDEFGSKALVELIETLAWKLRLDPTAIEEVESSLHSNQRDMKTVSLLLYALTKAGTQQTQDVLLSAYVGERTTPELSRAAAFAMLQLAEPSAVLLSVVVDRASRPGPEGRPDQASMLLLGALAPRNPAPLFGEHTALQSLVRMEDQARRNGSLPTWLEALGNTGSTEVMPHALRYLGTDDEAVRLAAVSALRDVHHTRASQELLRVAIGDESARIRAHALASLDGHDLGVHSQRVHHLAINDESRDVRQSAILLIAGGLGFDRAGRRVLEQIAAADPASENRQLASQVLARKG